MPAIEAASRFSFEIDGLAAATHVARFDGEEGLSRPFQFHLLLTSDDPDIAFADVIGKKALLTLDTSGSEPRLIHGIVSRFAHGEGGKKLNAYRATLVPSLWRLHHRHDSRIFQELTVPEIIEKVLKAAGILSSGYRLSLDGSHPKREYCVQYRESDLAFISRLMEEEGIHYFFEHRADEHVLVIADGAGAHEDITAPAAVVFRPPLGAMAHGESVSRFSYAEEMRPGKVTLGDFDFKKPSLSLIKSKEADADSDLEIYDHPGEYEAPADGEALAKIRLEEWQSVRRVGDGESGCIRFTPGYRFTLSEHPRDADNRRYLIVRVHHRGGQAQMGEASSEEASSYANDFQVVPDDVPYRPLRRTPRPAIKGVQTAIVVGPSGEEVHTDEHGRVKVQFHWDREGQRDEKSSCWIRVSQLWAGAGWGAMWLPRIGHEVIVDFIEGDPDRPIVVGRVYHGTNVPPYSLPSEKTKSTIKSDSSTGGGGSNELRFEDKKDSEEIYLHAQKDWKIAVENDKAQEIGNDETLHVVHDRTKTVDNDQHETIGNDKTIDVTANHTESIGGDESVTVTGNATREVGGDSTLTVTGTLTEGVSGDVAIAVDGAKEEEIGGDSEETVGGDRKTTVTGDYKLTVSGAIKISVDGAHETEVKGEKLAITCGDVKVTIEKSGAVKIEAKEVSIKGTSEVKVEAGKIKLKSDASIDLEASGAIKVKGSGVDLN